MREGACGTVAAEAEDENWKIVSGEEERYGLAREEDRRSKV
jgi:hypothetical protein